MGLFSNEAKSTPPPPERDSIQIAGAEWRGLSDDKGDQIEVGRARNGYLLLRHTERRGFPRVVTLSMSGNGVEWFLAAIRQLFPAPPPNGNAPEAPKEAVAEAPYGK